MPVEPSGAELLSLTQVTRALGKARKPRHPQSLYERIRRGTLEGVQQNGKWYIPRAAFERLLREPYHRRGGRPRVADTRFFLPRRHPRRRVEIPDVPEVVRLIADTTPSTRATLALRDHVLTRNVVRARLQLQHPHLSERELNLKLTEELSRHG